MPNISKTQPEGITMATTIIPLRNAAETALIERFEAERASLPGASEARAEAFARFTAQGLPGKRVEAYHYTDLRSMMRNLAPIPEAAKASLPNPLAELGFVTLAILNGVPQAIPALPHDLTIEPLADALADGRITLSAAMGAAEDRVVDLNTAFCRHGLVIRVAEGVAVETPLHLAFAETAAHASFMRVIVEIGAGASFTLVESHVGTDGAAYQANSVVELRIGENARCDHIRLNRAGDKALALSTLAATLGAEATLETLGVVMGGETSRHQVFVTYQGEGAKLAVRGATMLKGHQHADNTLNIDHAVPQGESRELFRTVLDGSAHGVFQGKIIVRPLAQKTDGQMASNAILLSDDAAMSNKPELEIFADDVVCAHGATCGALDENQLFYLMARGLPKAEAEALLVEAFIGETLDPLANEGLREALAGMVADWMRGRM
jgi:Fe-S cluster assembly protein SufD